MKNPYEVLREAQAIIGERGADYGGIESNFQRIVDLFELSTGVRIEPHRAAIFLVCVKLARMHQSPRKMDNYIDAINYLAFAAAMMDDIVEENGVRVFGDDMDLDDLLPSV